MYTPIQIMALVFLVVATIKIIVIIAKPSAWAGLVKKVWASSIITMIICLVLAIISFYYLLQELTLTQIFATMLLISLLAGAGIAMYSKEVVGVALKLLKDRTIIKKSWLYLIIWIALIIWGFKEFFM